MWRDVINLISETTTENDIGDVISVPVKRQVFANKLSYRNKAFYQAQANGLKPQMTFEIKEIDYEDEQELEFNNKTYRVIDVSPLKNENVGLICEGVVNRANA
jgi:SPP1 family predicted phage head-tail adaptor